jgi:hypothetical protein
MRGQPGRSACCPCCQHCEAPAAFSSAKAFAPGERVEYERADEYESDNVEEDPPQEHLEGDYPPDLDDLDDPGDDDDGLDEPGDVGDFDLDGEGVGDYIEECIKSLDAIEKGDFGALAEEVSAMALEGALIALQAERLALGRSVQRLTGR